MSFRDLSDDIITTHILPKLTVNDLGKMACVCRSLKEALYSNDSVWQDAAIYYLPAIYQPVFKSKRERIYAIISKYHALKNYISNAQERQRCCRSACEKTPIKLLGPTLIAVCTLSRICIYNPRTTELIDTIDWIYLFSPQASSDTYIDWQQVETGRKRQNDYTTRVAYHGSW